MVKKTEGAASSAPPAFMAKQSDKIAEKSEKAQKSADKEAGAQDEDAMAKRLATIKKSTVRVTEMSEYLLLIDKAVATSLPKLIELHPMGQALDNFAELEDAVTLLEKQYKSIKERMAYAREVTFPSRMDAEESKTFTSAETGHRISRTARLFASIVSDKIDVAYDWLRANGLAPLIKETVNSSSLSAAAKELMANGSELPEEIFTVHMKDSVSITRKKAK